MPGAQQQVLEHSSGSQNTAVGPGCGSGGHNKVVLSLASLNAHKYVSYICF